MIAFVFSFWAYTAAFADVVVPAGCLASRNFSVEAYKVWISDGVSMHANHKASASLAAPVGKRVDLKLVSSDAEFRGFVNFETLLEGDYVIVTDAYPRMNLIDSLSGESLAATDFGKIRDCGTLNKALRFHLPLKHKFNLEFISSHGESLNFLIWRLQ